MDQGHALVLKLVLFGLFAIGGLLHLKGGSKAASNKDESDEMNVKGWKAVASHSTLGTILMSGSGLILIGQKVAPIITNLIR